MQNSQENFDNEENLDTKTKRRGDKINPTPDGYIRLDFISRSNFYI